jgi:hypothetical protein
VQGYTICHLSRLLDTTSVMSCFLRALLLRKVAKASSLGSQNGLVWSCVS